MSLKLGAFALFFTGCFFVGVIAAEPSLAPGNSVLALRNGGILTGRITKLGDSYVLSFGSANELRLPAATVEFHCQSVDDVYLSKRDALGSNEVDSHLRLAEWCLRHDLLARAADQLLAVVALDHDHPAIEPLQRRLVIAEGLARRRSLDSSTSSAEPNSTGSQTGNAPARNRSSTPEISARLIEAFANFVHPVLLNRCAAGNCHGTTNASQFHLMRPLPGRAITRRFTERNLEATLAQLDFSAPDESPFLKALTAEHGGMSTGSPEATETQVQLLRAWVKEVTGQAAKPRTAMHHQPSFLSQSHAPTDPDESQPTKSERLATSGSPDNFTPRDPFDPEIFNRQSEHAP